VHQGGDQHHPHHLRAQADHEEGPVLVPEVRTVLAAEGPVPVEHEVGQVRHQERDHHVQVVVADVEVGERQVDQHVVGPHPHRVPADDVGQHQHRLVDQHAEAADESEAEELDQAVPVAGVQVVEAHSALTLPGPPRRGDAAGSAGTDGRSGS